MAEHTPAEINPPIAAAVAAAAAAAAAEAAAAATAVAAAVGGSDTADEAEGGSSVTYDLAATQVRCFAFFAVLSTHQLCPALNFFTHGRAVLHDDGLATASDGRGARSWGLNWTAGRVEK